MPRNPDTSDDQPDDGEQVSMSFGDHLEELRRRLLRAFIGVGVISCVTLYYGRVIVLWLCQPLFEAQRQAGLPQQTLNLSVAGGLMVFFKVGMIAGIVIGSPWVIYQLWCFIRPGLRSAERRVFRIIGPLSAAMTALGVIVLYYFFLPASISFLLLFSTQYPPPTGGPDDRSSLQTVTTFFNKLNNLILSPPGTPSSGVTGIPGNNPATNPADIGENIAPAHVRIPVLDRTPPNPVDGDVWFDRANGELRIVANGKIRVMPAASTSFMVPQIEINEYLNFVLLMALVTMTAFQLPVVMAMLAAVGIADANWLAKKRKAIVFIFFVLAVVFTPSQDLFSNIIFPLLLWGLFEVGLIAMRLVRRDSVKT